MESREKAEKWEPKAKEAQRLTAELNTYIDGLKNQILKAADFDPAKKGDSTFKEDNQDIATRIMVKEGKGKELYKRLEQYKADIAKIEGSQPDAVKSVVNDINTYLKQINLETPPTKNKANKNWEDVYFRMVPTVASITMLSKFQNDIKTVENRVIGRFHEEVGAVVVRFNKFATIKGQNSNYLMPGQKLMITAGVGAFSDQAQPIITIGGRRIEVNEKGIAEFETVINSIGQGSIPIHYEWTDQEGKKQTYDDKVTYEVGQSNAAIALPKMNVMYVGIDNEVLISGGGVGAEKIRASITSGSGSLSGSNGKFIARVNAGADVVITASADGKVLGSSQFRVRNVPKAQASVGGYESGATVTKGAFGAQTGVGAGIKDFPLDLKYSVTSFQVVADDPNTGDVLVVDVSGNTWNQRARQAINGVQPGSIITIESIRCLGPDGRTTTLPSLLYNIK